VDRRGDGSKLLFEFLKNLSTFHISIQDLISQIIKRRHYESE